MMKIMMLPLAVLLSSFILLSGCIGQENVTPKPTTQPPPKTTQPPLTQPPPSTTQAPQTTQPPVSTTQAPSTTLPPSVRTFTMDEVAKHNTRNDCWLVIGSNVYDITSFVPSHPGGSIIEQGCGKDANALFGSFSHSKSARDLLAKYFMGILVKI